MNVKEKIEELKNLLTEKQCKLIAVSKTKPVSMLMEVYETGIRQFGENKAQELTDKYNALPKDIAWHMIGHLQRNKVKYIVPFIHLIQSVDSIKLLREIEKQSEKCNRTVNCLLQIHIAEEETKFGLDKEELLELLGGPELPQMRHIQINGLMGMATFTENESQVRREFRALRKLFEAVKSKANLPENVVMKELSMGMSGDYKIAIEEGSTMVRIGTAIFGKRN